MLRIASLYDAFACIRKMCLPVAGCKVDACEQIGPPCMGWLHVNVSFFSIYLFGSAGS